MDTPTPIPHNVAVNGLITAISRNADEGILARSMGSQWWYVVADYLEPRTYPRGHLLISQGANDRTLYFLESGSLKVDVQTKDGFVELAILGPGTVVGEGSFFSRLSRNASVLAYSDCRVWALSATAFDALADKHPCVALSLCRALGGILATRMLQVSRRIAIT